MKERLEEAESMGVRRMKAQVQAMEGRVGSLEEQLDAATRYGGEREGWHEYIIMHTKQLSLSLKLANCLECFIFATCTGI